MSAEERTKWLLRMAASVEEAIIRFETRMPDDSHETVARLRRLQADILTTVARLDGDSQPRA